MRLTFLFLALFATAPLFAQYHSLHLQGGWTYSHLQANTKEAAAFTAHAHGPYGGLEYENEFFSRGRYSMANYLGTGLSFASLGGYRNGADVQPSYYLTVPLLLGARWNGYRSRYWRFKVELGAELGVRLNHRSFASDLPWGAVHGLLGAEVVWKRWHLGIRGQVGLLAERQVGNAVYRHLGGTLYFGCAIWHSTGHRRTVIAPAFN